MASMADSPSPSTGDSISDGTSALARTDPAQPAPHGDDRLAQALREATEYTSSQVDLPGKIQIGKKSQQSLAQLLESAKETQRGRRDGFDVTITALGPTAPATLKATTVDALFYTLDPAQYEVRPRVICMSGLSEAAIGLLGSMLKIDPYYFAMHLNRGTVSASSALNRSRIETHHRYMKFEYKRVDIDGTVQAEAISVYVADITNGMSTAIILLDDYDLQSETSSAGQINNSTLQEAILNYIIDSEYSSERQAPRPWEFLPLAAITVLTKEWSSVLTRGATVLENIYDLINKVPWAESRSARVEMINTARQLRSQIPSKQSFFKDTILDINTSRDLLMQCNADTEGFNTVYNRDSQLLMAELQQLSIEATQVNQSNEEINGRAAVVLSPPGSSEDNGSNGQGHDQAKNPDKIQAEEEKNKHRARFQNHIETKIDQIAYVTSGLLSMSFIASIYGMNLDIFTDGGYVSLSKFLYTSLPFTFGILLLTFGPQYVRAAMHMKKIATTVNLYLV